MGPDGGGTTITGLAGIGSGVFRPALITTDRVRCCRAGCAPAQGLDGGAVEGLGGGRTMGAALLSGKRRLSGERGVGEVTAARRDGVRRSRTGLHKT